VGRCGIVPEKRWKVVERKLARDMGVERIPVTGERDGSDFEDAIGCYQVKSRKCIPGWLADWLAGITGTARRKNKAGVLVLHQPGQPRTEAIVVTTWSDWVSLHGEPHE
jgi:hypothetical protein